MTLSGFATLGLEHRLRFLYNNKRNLYALLIPLILVPSITVWNYISFRGSGVPPTPIVNEICSCNKAVRENYCDVPPSFQFEKFIWFITDGWPYYRAQESMSYMIDESVVYTTAVRGTR
jgi:hypothetical protein